MLLNLFKRKPPAEPPAEAIAPPGGEAAAWLRELEWTVIRRLDGLLQGDYRTLMRGTGLDLADLREYQVHDDVRHIDWNVTARLQQPHVRVFTEDREMAAWFLLDLSPSVDFGSGDQRKSDVLTGFVAVIARLISRHGNRVGAVLYGAGGSGQVDGVLPARGGRTQVLQLMQRMRWAAAGAKPATSRPASAMSGSTRLADLLHMAAHTVRQRCTVLVVSDFISEPGWEKPLGELARRHDVVVVRLLDPLELQLPNLGLVTVRDAETGEQLRVDLSDAALRQRFARLAAQREAQLRETLVRVGVDALELATDDDLTDAVMRFLMLRKRRSLGRGAPQISQTTTAAALGASG